MGESDKVLDEVPAGELTVINFFRRMASEMDPVTRETLNYMARSLIERGWLVPVEQLVEQLSEDTAEGRVRAAIDELRRCRLVEMDPKNQRFTGFLGIESVARTPHRGHLQTGVNIFTHGGMDLLALNPTLLKPVDAFTMCGQCDAEITVHISDESIQSATPTGVAGFQANWDGHEPLRRVARRSPLFCSDQCLEAWTEAHSDIDGLPLSADLLLHVGMALCADSGSARFELIRYQ